CSSQYPAGKKLCNFKYVDVDDPDYGCDPLACGHCGIPSFAHASACSSGKCTITGCMPGRADCDGNFQTGCEPSLTSAEYCGTCEHACNAGQVCDGQTCAATCTFGKTNCNGACHDLTSDPVACGNCNTTCHAGLGTSTCVAAKCNILC